MSNTAITQSSIFGIGPGVGAGMWTLVERKTLLAPATNVTFSSGVDGNSAIRHKIVYRMVCAVSGSDRWAYLRINGDDSTSAYPQTYFYAKGGNAPGAVNYSSYPGIIVTNTRGGVGVLNVGNIEIFTQTGAARVYLAQGIQWETVAPPYKVTTDGYYTETATNITSYVFSHDQTDGIGAGSVVELWKLAQ